MSIAFVPLNGIGLGHVSRSFALACELKALGEAPVIFSQGIYPDFMAAEIPGLSVGPIYTLRSREKEKVIGRIESFVLQSSPVVIIEDTHPAGARYRQDVCTLLVVRPLEMPSMRELHRKSQFFRRFLIADHPDSPTWPYREAATAEILSWSDWKVMGPVFRSPTREGRERVRQKYRLQPDERLFVFTMGGGGSQPGSHDAQKFIERAQTLATQIIARIPEARCLFIRGPLFPASLETPQPFESCAVEPDMPSLLAEASGVVGRPSFNTVWECIGAGTPLMPIVGATFHEPIDARLQRMWETGFLTTDLEQWFDPDWLAAFHLKAETASLRWPLRSAAEVLRSCYSSLQSAASGS